MKTKVVIKINIIIFGIAGLFFLSCKDKIVTVEETMTAGKATFLVDSSVQPIIEDALAVFTNTYDRAQIKQVNKSETEVVRDLLSDSAGVAILSRKLTPEEEARFRNRKIEPKITEFASDAIAFVAHEQAADSVIQLQEVIKVLRGQPSLKIRQLVFDNPNSGTVQYLLKAAGVQKLPAVGVYALKSNEDVLKYVRNNNGAIGVIGLNWLLQPPASLTKVVESIQVLGVNNVNFDKSGTRYYKPNQSNMATGAYPLMRKLYVLNYQGKQGLGMGFANYISAPDGQRLILKSGLLPVNIPKRELEVRNEL